jgi:hypothetical protein
MTSKGSEETQQMSLDLKPPRGDTVMANARSTPGHVIGFVDLGTINVRQNAIRRLQRSGIFAPPSTLVVK